MFFIKEEVKINSVISSCVNEQSLELCLEWIENLSNKMNNIQINSLRNRVMEKWTEIELNRVNSPNRSY